MNEEIVIEFETRRQARQAWRHIHRVKKMIQESWEELPFTFPKGSVV